MKYRILCMGFAALALSACNNKKEAEEPGRDTMAGTRYGGQAEERAGERGELRPGQQVGADERPNVVWLEAYSYELDVPEQRGMAPDRQRAGEEREGVRWSHEREMTEEERRRHEEWQRGERRRHEEWQRSEAGQRARESTRRLAEDVRTRTGATVSPSERAGGGHTIDISREARNIMVERNMQEARVKARICVSEEGQPMHVELVDRSGVDAIDNKVREAMQTWRYKPQTIGGEAVPFCELVTFRYQLRYGQDQQSDRRQ